MQLKKYILDFKDEEGKRYTWLRKNYNRKRNKHPELEDENIAVKRIKETILNYDYIYRSYQQKYRFCYYKKEYELAGRPRYTKVVVQKNKGEYIIITAFMPDTIHEKKYNYQPLCKRP
ncbi:DUF4258 domain-containing protein [Candidatus Woesebacteria bacterium]|nr:DUF4258 domain-containing protein [Candidatus Woesebacteria bacterium]